MADKSEKLDETDRHLLRLVQVNAALSLETLAGELSISTNSAWRRVKRLEEAGVIARRVAIVEPDKVGLGMTVFVAVKTKDHSQDWIDRFARAAAAIPEIVEFYRMAGDVDYLLKLLVRDVSDYDRVYKKLIATAPMSDVSASFAMERIKHETAVPV